MKFYLVFTENSNTAAHNRITTVTVTSSDKTAYVKRMGPKYYLTVAWDTTENN